MQRVDNLVTPQFTGDETFFEALFAGAPVTFADLQGEGAKGRAAGADVAARQGHRSRIDNTYEIVSSSSRRNVVGMVEGSDPKLKDTYIMFGAHLDHVGYSQTGGGGAADASALPRSGASPHRPPSKRRGRPCRTRAARRGAGGPRRAAPTPFDQRDIISNGADDDGSGSTALMAIAKAFATGPKPKRSIVFVWHTGEEAGLLRLALQRRLPVVPLEKSRRSSTWTWSAATTATTSKATTRTRVFIVGADRISTDLHNLIVETNTRWSSR